MIARTPAPRTEVMRTVLGPRFEEALAYALHVHAAQYRKGTPTPYFAHLMGVAAIVLENGGNEDQAIAALLHDAPEDAGGRERLEDIRLRFGDEVAHIVEACTDTFAHPKPAWLARKKRYIDNVPHHDAAVHLVSLADKVHNARTILYDYRRDGEALWRRFSGGRERTIWYYEALGDVYSQVGPFHLAAELVRIVKELKSLVHRNDQTSHR